MREPYRPAHPLAADPVIGGQLQRQSDAYYASAGVETELLKESAGYRLAVFVHGKEVPGGLAAFPMGASS